MLLIDEDGGATVDRLRRKGVTDEDDRDKGNNTARRRRMVLVIVTERIHRGDKKITVAGEEYGCWPRETKRRDDGGGDRDETKGKDDVAKS